MESPKLEKGVRLKLEKLLEKLLNKKGYECPTGHGLGDWKYAGNHMLKGKREAMYRCGECNNTFYRQYIKFYNDGKKSS